MNKDYHLLNEALDALLKTRSWLSADYYRMNINPVVEKLKERLASIEVEKFYSSKKEKEIPEFNEYETDTIPTKLLEATTNFGIFNDLKSEHCKSHPNAPHRYLKELSISMGRYVCQCEFWEPKL